MYLQMVWREGTEVKYNILFIDFRLNQNLSLLVFKPAEWIYSVENPT